MTSYTELLEPTTSEKHVAFVWTPACDTGNAHTPHAGVLTITTSRSYAVYDVEEFPCDHGRGFMLFKTAGGTDRTEERYAVFCGSDDVGQCECKGFTRYGRCKHLQSVAELVRAKRL